MEKQTYFKPSLLAIAVTMAFPAAVRADEVTEMISPDVTEVAVSVFNLNKVNPLYRQYTGLDHKGVNGSLDFNFVKRSEEGFWLRAEGRNLGLETQEFKASAEQQGDWAVGIAYDQIPHYGPYQISTPVAGIGTNNLTLPSLTPGEQTLQTERTATSLTIKKFIYDNLVVNVGFKNEDKKGARLMGANGNTNGYIGMLFTPEPIDSNHKQFEASLEYYTKKFQVTAGYYGSFFQNNAGNALNVNYGTNNNNAIVTSGTQMSPMSLSPDNHANEFYVSGGYNFSDDTRATMKLAKTWAIQNSTFASIPYAGIAGSPGYNYGTTRITPRSNLDGEVQTTNMAAALTSRLTKDLSMLASWSYEDLNDKTPKDLYLYDHGTTTAPIYNNPESQKSNRGKFELTYRLPASYAVTAGYDYDQKKYPGMEELFRDEVIEQTYRVEVRKSLSEVLNGSIRLAHSSRGGSDWGAPAAQSNGNYWIMPAQFSDRERNKVRLMLDWTPADALSVQFAYEYNLDDYTTRVNDAGLRKGKAELYSLDAIYRISDKWKSSVWYSHNTNNIDQRSLMASFARSCANTTAANTCVLWDAKLNMKGDSVGVGIDGKVSGRIDVGAKLFYTHDTNHYNINVDQSLVQYAFGYSGVGILPDTTFTQTSLRMFGRYAVSKATSLRLDYIWDQRKMDDYTWSNWQYSDGTKVFVSPRQTTQIIGVTLVQAF